MDLKVFLLLAPILIWIGERLLPPLQQIAAFLETFVPARTPPPAPPASRTPSRPQTPERRLSTSQPPSPAACPTPYGASPEDLSNPPCLLPDHLKPYSTFKKSSQPYPGWPKVQAMRDEERRARWRAAPKRQEPDIEADVVEGDSGNGIAGNDPFPGVAYAVKHVEEIPGDGQAADAGAQAAKESSETTEDEWEDDCEPVDNHLKTTTTSRKILERRAKSPKRGVRFMWPRPAVSSASVSAPEPAEDEIASEVISADHTETPSTTGYKPASVEVAVEEDRFPSAVQPVDVPQFPTEQQGPFGSQIPPATEAPASEINPSAGVPQESFVATGATPSVEFCPEPASRPEPEPVPVPVSMHSEAPSAQAGPYQEPVAVSGHTDLDEEMTEAPTSSRPSFIEVLETKMAQMQAELKAHGLHPTQSDYQAAFNDEQRGQIEYWMLAENTKEQAPEYEGLSFHAFRECVVKYMTGYMMVGKAAEAEQLFLEMLHETGYPGFPQRQSEPAQPEPPRPEPQGPQQPLPQQCDPAFPNNDWWPLVHSTDVKNATSIIKDWFSRSRNEANIHSMDHRGCSCSCYQIWHQRFQQLQHVVHFSWPQLPAWYNDEQAQALVGAIGIAFASGNGPFRKFRASLSELSKNQMEAENCLTMIRDIETQLAQFKQAKSSQSGQSGSSSTNYRQRY